MDKEMARLNKVSREANAAFIVRAVNAHEELVDAMTQAVLALTNAVDWHNCDEETGDECKGLKCWMGEHRAACILENAIASAEGK